MQKVRDHISSMLNHHIYNRLDHRWIGVTAALISALGYGSGAIASKHVVTHHTGPITATAFSLLFGAILVLGLFYKDLISDFKSSPTKAWIIMNLLG